MAYGTRIYIDHIDQVGGQDLTARIEVLERDYTGSATEMRCYDDVYGLTYNGGDIKKIWANPVQKGQLSVMLRIKDANDIPLLNDIVAGDEKQFLLRIKFNGDIKWTGYIIPDIISYKEGPYPFGAELLAKDLHTLEGEDFQTTNAIDYQRQIVTIAGLVNSTGLDLNINVYSDFTTSQFTDSEDYFFETEPDLFQLQNFGEFSEGSYGAINKMEALEKLVPKGFVLRQWDNEWHLLDLGYLAKNAGVVDRYKYDATGQPISNTADVDLVIDIDQVSRYLLGSSENKPFPGYKKTKLEFNHKAAIQNILFDSEYVIDSPTQFPEETLKVTAGSNRVVEISGDIEVVTDTDPGSFRSGDAEILVQVADEEMELQAGGWDPNNGTDTISVSSSNNTLTRSFKFTSEAIPPDIDEATLTVSMRWATVSGETVQQVRWKNMQLSLTNGEKVSDDASINYELTQAGEYSKHADLGSTVYGQGPNEFCNSALRFFDDLGQYKVLNGFGRKGGASYSSYSEFVMSTIMNLQRGFLRNIRADLWAFFTPLNVIRYDGSLFFFLQGGFKGYGSLWNGDLVELKWETSANDTLTEKFKIQSGDSGTQLPPSSGDPGSTISDHGQLNGLGDDDHPQYLNQARGDARYIRPNTTPTLNQVVLNNPASQDTHALRGGQVLNTSIPITGGGKLRNGLDVGLNYEVTNLKITSSKLNTIQDIDPDADMTLKSLYLKTNLELHDDNGGITTQTFAGGFGGSGAKLDKVNGYHELTVDDLVVRRLARFYEIVVEKVRANGGTIVVSPGAEKIIDSSQTGDASWDFNATGFNPFAGDSPGGGVEYTFADQYECFIEEDKFITIAPDDLVWRQQWTGRGTGVTQGIVIATETGSATETDNSTPRSFTVSITNASQPPEGGHDFAVIGNRTDPSRQNGIIITASDTGNPYRRVYAGVDSLDKFGDTSTIKGQDGRLDNLDVSHLFPELDGTQTNKYGAFWDGDFYVNNGHVRGKIVITDEAGSNAATKAYVDDQAGGNVTIRKDAPSPTARPGGGALEDGDIWIETDNNDRIWTYNGTSDVWEDTETVIDGSRISITLDQVADGSTYQRTASSALDANGLVVLSQATGDLDDVSDGSTYQRVKKASLTSDGLVLLSQASGNLDDISNGTNYAKILKTEVSAGHILIKGTDGQTVIDGGTIDLDTLLAVDATISSTLSVPGGNVKIGEGVYNSPLLGSQNGILAGSGGTMLYSDQGIDFDANQTTGKQIEWHRTAVTDDLCANSNLVGELQVDVDEPSQITSFRIRAQTVGSGWTSRIIMTASELDINAKVGGIDYQRDSVSLGTGEQTLYVTAPIMEVDAEAGTRIVEVDTSGVVGSIAMVMVINKNSDGSNFGWRDDSQTSHIGANVQANMDANYDHRNNTNMIIVKDSSGDWIVGNDHGA